MQLSMVMHNPITSYRADNKLSLEAFGNLFGIHKATALRWERVGAPTKRLVEIEEKTGISRADLRPDLFKGFSP